jgi:hypothetical protein
MEIEKAAVENRDQMEIAQLASKLLELCGSREGLRVDEVEGKERTLAA